ncbi:MAG: NAD-dependent epimerase/dehydratase family protein, partial [Gammaproteobacteria bacterium]
MAKILIAGCGDVGSKLAELLTGQGHRVIGLRRHPPPAGTTTIDYYPADLTQPTDLAGLDTDFEQVFYMPAPDGRGADAYRAAYLAGQRNLLTHFSGRLRYLHWFLISSTSVYGQSNGEWVDEASPAEAATETGAIVREAEKLPKAFGVDTTVVRCSG